jgi:putative salt-induced outer membrane protein
MATMTHRIALMGVAVLGCSAAVAQEEAGGPWSLAVSASGYAARGNTDETNIAGSAELGYDGVQWDQSAYFRILRTEKDGDTSTDRWETGYKADYLLNEISYLFGRGDYTKDDFSDIQDKYVLAAGYGRRVINTDRHHLNLEIGPGYRYQERADNSSDSEIIGLGAADYTWKISENAEFTETFQVEWGSSNTYVESVSKLASTIIGQLSMFVAFEVRYNSDTEEVDRKATDYATRLGLEYKF